MTLIERIVSLRKVLGISVKIEAKQLVKFSYVLLEMKGDELNILDFTNNSSFGQIPFQVNLPIVLNVYGDSVITKGFSDSTSSEKDLLDSILPGMKQKDFELQFYKGKNNFCSVIRKEMIPLIEESFNIQKENIVQLSLDSFAISTVLNLIKSKDELWLEGKNFHIEEEEINSIELSNLEETFLIDNKELCGDELSAFAVAFQYLYPGLEKVATTSFDENENELRHHILFDKLKWIIPIAALVLLMINFLIFSAAFLKNEQLNSMISANRDLLNEVNILKSELETKEVFLKEEQWFAFSKSSFYTDRIAASIQGRVSLEYLNIFPSEEVEEAQFSYDYHHIKLKGLSEEPSLVNDWLKILKKEDWVSAVELEDYKQQSSNGQIEFELTIDLMEK